MHRSRFPHRSSLSFGLALLLAAASGCRGSCDTACARLKKCASDLDSERMTAEECQESCERERDLYDAWDDDEKRKAFRKHLTCVANSTCEELDEGVCYDELLFIYEPG